MQICLYSGDNLQLILGVGLVKEDVFPDMQGYFVPHVHLLKGSRVGNYPQQHTAAQIHPAVVYVAQVEAGRQPALEARRRGGVGIQLANFDVLRPQGQHHGAGLGAGVADGLIDIREADAPALRAGMQEVHLAHEVCHELIHRALVDVLRGAYLLDNAPVDDDDPVGHGHGLGLVVGYVDHGDAQLGLDLLDLKAHGFAQLGV